MKKVNIKVDTKGNVNYEAEGFQGQGCADALKILEDNIAAKTEDPEKKEEFYLQETEEVHSHGY